MRRTLVLVMMITWVLSLTIIRWEGAGLAAAAESACEKFGIIGFPDKKPAAPFTLDALDGKQVSLANFKGKSVMLFMWVSWCESCKDELPLIETFAQQNKDQLAVLLVAIDGERREKIEAIINKSKVASPVLLMKGKYGDKLMDEYKVRGYVPQTFLVDSNGLLIGKIIGPRQWDSVEAMPCMKDLFGLP